MKQAHYILDRCKYTLGVACAFILFTPFHLGGSLAWSQEDNKGLVSYHNKILKTFPNVEHIGRTDFKQNLAPKDPVLFDVREQAEYDVSHIKGAYFVPPNMSAEDFYDEYGELIKGRDIVVYCSVGWRSSKFASRIMSDIEAYEVQSLYNLRGGIFGWHNDEERLSRFEKSVDVVHPYSRWRARLIERQDKISYSPKP